MIEPANPTDVARLRWEWALENDPRLSDRIEAGGPDHSFVAAVAEWMAGGRTVFTARHKGTAAGLVSLTEHRRMPSPNPAAAGSWGYLGHLYVRPAARGHGLGERLIERVLEIARERGYTKVVLAPTELSVPLYRRAGFGREHDLLMWRPGPGALPSPGQVR